MTISRSHSLGILDFPKLKGRADYRRWAQRMEIALVLEGHWDVISNDTGSPQSWSEEHGGYDVNGKGIIRKEALTEEELNKFEEEQAIWNRHNNKARALPSLCISLEKHQEALSKT